MKQYYEPELDEHIQNITYFRFLGYLLEFGVYMNVFLNQINGYPF